MALMSSANAFVPQMHEDQMTFFRKVAPLHDSLPLPTPIEKDILGIINTIQRNMGINKFLFQGAPGTGKTESVQQIARILERDLFCVDFDTIIATTNLFKHFDKALSRRFDLIVDFNRYTQEDLQEIAESILNNFLSKYKIGYRNTRLFRKILGLQKKISCPSEMKKNSAKRSLLLRRNNRGRLFRSRL